MSTDLIFGHIYEVNMTFIFFFKSLEERMKKQKNEKEVLLGEEAAIMSWREKFNFQLKPGCALQGNCFAQLGEEQVATKAN